MELKGGFCQIFAVFALIFSLKGVYACTNCPPICPPNCPPNPIFSPFCDLENGTKKALLGSIFSASSPAHLTGHLTVV